MKLTSNKHQPINSVAIVGAGMSGVSCAVSLALDIPKVVVFETLDAAGGRMAMLEEESYQFDYGAQYFTVRSEDFSERVSEWENEWLVDEWQGWLVDLHDGQALSHEDGVKRYVSRPGMDSLVKQMAALCDIQYSTTVTKVKKNKIGWQLWAGKNKLMEEFDAVILAIPAPQAVKLLSSARKLKKLVNSVNISSCWAVMFGFAKRIDLAYDAAYVVGSDISWMARNNSKPERSSQESWIIHAAFEWSDNNAKADPVEVCRHMFNEFKEATKGNIAMPAFAKAHYWPYAKPVNSLHQDCIYDSEINLGLCGDWCATPRVEGAFTSGIEMARKILNHGSESE